MNRLLLLLLLAPAVANGQPGDKGSFFAYWGYNRAAFSYSDLHLDGPGYDFILRGITAKDRPSAFSPGLYFNPSTIWIPQYNYRIGWFVRDNWSISIGLDHMKYVMVQDQVVRMDGTIDGGRSIPWAGDPANRDVRLTDAFLKFEHTDGLNLLSIDADHYERLWASSDARFRVRAYQGAHGGPVIPRSDVRVFGTGLNNRFNLAGFGVGAQLGFHIDFLRHFFVRNTLKAGWIDLPHVLTTGTDEDHAHQHFWFLQHNIVVGGCFRLGVRKSAPL
jgi:hypothetical protein